MFQSYASSFTLSFSIQSETYIEHDPNFAFLFVSPTFSLFLLLFLCAFSMVSLLFDGCSSIGRNKNELGKREKKDWKCLGPVHDVVHEIKSINLVLPNNSSGFVLLHAAAFY